MNPNILFLAILFLNMMCLNSQTQTENVTIGNKILFTSNMYNEERTLLISLPENYDESNKKYPVLYRLDGEYIFVETVTETKRLSDIQEIIIVCIQNVDRGRDMLPSNSQYSPKGGSNEKFLQFIKNELIPYIDNNYWNI